MIVSHYDLETKIRQIVQELADPAMQRAQHCIHEVERLAAVLDDQREK